LNDAILETNVGSRQRSRNFKCLWPSMPYKCEIRFKIFKFKLRTFCLSFFPTIFNFIFFQNNLTIKIYSPVLCVLPIFNFVVFFVSNQESWLKPEFSLL
jgi:hypothetical protein